LDYFIDHLDVIGKTNKISLLLYTRGGGTMAAYSIVKLIRQFCKEFEVIVPSKSHSAGTLICLGANTIVMTKQATLGPIDPTLHHALSPQDPRQPQNSLARVGVSVESINSYISYLRSDLNIDTAQDLKDVVLNLSNFIHPIVLGEVYRSRTQIKMLAEKLLAENKYESEKVDEIIKFLTADSGSHDYTIYRNEAKMSLGLNIETPDDNLYALIKSLYDNIAEELLFRETEIVNLVPDSPIKYEIPRVLLESVNWGRHYYVTEGTKQLIAGLNQFDQPFQAIQNNISFEGWKFEEVNID